MCAQLLKWTLPTRLLLSPSQIYICGGFDGEDSLQTAEYYDPETDQWTVIASMGTQRSGLGVVAYVGHIYVVSGTFSLLNPFSNPDLTHSGCSFSRYLSKVNPFLFPLTGRWIWWPQAAKKRRGLQPPKRLMEPYTQHAYCTQQLWYWSIRQSGICCWGLQRSQQHLFCRVLWCKRREVVRGRWDGKFPLWIELLPDIWVP